MNRRKVGYHDVKLVSSKRYDGSIRHELDYSFYKERNWSYCDWHDFKKEKPDASYRDMLSLRTWDFTHRHQEEYFSLTEWDSPCDYGADTYTFYKHPDYPNLIGWMKKPEVVVMPKTPPCCLTCKWGDQGNHGDEPTSCPWAPYRLEQEYGGYIKCEMYQRKKWYCD